MAAVLACVVGVMVGAVATWAVMDYRQFREQEVERRLREAMQPQRGDDAILERVLDRLLGAVVPEPRPEPPADTVSTGSPGEYEAPDAEVGDWTDPFIGIDRPMVARLEPGQQIPGMGLERDDVDGGGVDAVEAWRESGVEAFDEWARDTMVPDGQVGGWVEPLDLGGEDRG